jgi:molybdopterin-guanine dinucleotide biosynthesis protein A
MTAFTLAIIAGGKSSRMGTDKAFVEILGKTMIEHILKRTANIGQSETILITNRLKDYARLNLPMHTDVVPDKGSLGGIYTAIHHSQQPYTLVVACDMPFLNPDLLRYMVGLCEANQFDVIVPRVDQYPQGLHAIYSKACLKPIRQRIDADRLRVIGFYPDVRVRYIDEPEYEKFDPAKTALRNINTPEELAEARRIAGDEPK